MNQVITADDRKKLIDPCTSSFGCTSKNSTAVETVHLLLIPSAIFIILILGAAGILSNSALGWSIAGLAGGGFVYKLLGGDFKKRAFPLIVSGTFAALMVVIGCLGGTGILAGALLITALFISHFMGSSLESCTKTCRGCYKLVKVNQDD